MILCRIFDAFNGLYRIGDGIGEQFNCKGGIEDGFDSIALARLAVCGLILNVNMYCGIDDILQQKKRIKLMKAYQINDGLNDTKKEVFIVLIRDGIGDGFNGKGRRYFDLLLLLFQL